MIPLDVALATLHHVIVFPLVGIVLAELMLVRGGMDIATVRRVATIDAWYGALAGLIVLVGLARAVFAAKGWSYYSHNLFFWSKMGAFVLIGLLSIPPTLAYLRWRKGATPPTDEAVRKVRRYLLIELMLFAPVVTFAVAMARGYGSF